jgi:predicted O-methyltransferase YrrM
MEKLQSWQAITENVQGFFMAESAAVWDVLLEFHDQTDSFVAGNILEIGVWRGKSAALAALHTRSNEELILCDTHFSDETKRLLSSIKPERITYLEGNSANLVGSSEALRYAKQCRWIHIDGEHTGQSVTHDLMLADQWLSEKGVICCDDFMNPAYPQVSRWAGLIVR